MYSIRLFVCFFFQAEDGIRDTSVTGVQTCALPISDLLPPSEIGEARIERRQKLREIVDDTVKNFEGSESANLMDTNFSSAFKLMTSTKARNAFDLSKEPEAVRTHYGMSRFGQCCL